MIESHKVNKLQTIDEKKRLLIENHNIFQSRTKNDSLQFQFMK
jgi:hypothetical protein